MALGFKSQPQPKKKGLNLYYPLRHSWTYGEPRPAECEDLKALTLHRGRKNVKN
jgi:hypothetical protein